MDSQKRQLLEASAEPLTLGAELRRHRRRAKLGQAELARRMGTTASAISRVERGAGFRVETLIELARNLGLEPVLVPKADLATVRALLRASENGDEVADDGPRFG